MDKSNQIMAVGRRKEAVANVRLRPGKGLLIVNGLDAKQYFGLDKLVMIAKQPLELLEVTNKFDIIAKVKGGGKAGQAGALTLGIARALVKYNEDYRPTLRSAGFLTRDPREKERKKYGLAKARKRYQFSKR